MTESQWLASTQRTPMLAFLRAKTSKRKMRLFAAACCRRILPLQIDENNGLAIAIAERYADGRCSDEELAAAHKAARFRSKLAWRIADKAKVKKRLILPHITDAICICVSSDVKLNADLVADYATRAVASDQSYDAESFYKQSEAEAVCQIAILRDIFGNPYRPATFKARWLSSQVVGLARTIYDTRSFERMPALGEALMDAGCNNEDVLDHCRAPGPHVLGCWVVDLILGKQ